MKPENLPLHLKKKLMHVALNKELRAQLKRRSIGIRKGDQVQIIKGKFKGTQGMVSSVDLKSMKIYVDAATVKKRNGTQAQVPLATSKLRITKLVTTDKKRQQTIGPVSKDADSVKQGASK